MSDKQIIGAKRVASATPFASEYVIYLLHQDRRALEPHLV